MNLRKTFQNEYSVKVMKPKFIKILQHQYLSITRSDNPNGSFEYSKKTSALFGLAFTLKFLFKKSQPAIDYDVMPLEGLWWEDDMSQFSLENRGSWQWK